MRRVIVGYFLICMLSSCGGGQMWYKQGATQADFNLDAQECEIIAHELARQATVSGERENLEVFIKSYNNCLFLKGWSHIPPNQKAGNQKQANFNLAKINQNSIEAFGKRFNLPKEFKLLKENKSVFGPTLIHSFFLQGTGPTFINLIFQQSLDLDFEPADYPVEEPFFLYDRGSEEEKNIRWSVYCGQINDEWIVGLGSFFLISEKERIILIVTSPLPQQTTPPPKGLRLTKKQKDATEKFVKSWKEWILNTFSP
jgi:hypothetical protein